MDHELALFSIMRYHLMLKKDKPTHDAATVHNASPTDNNASGYVFAMGIVKQCLLLYNNLTSTLANPAASDSLMPVSTKPHICVITIFPTNNFELP